MSAYKRASYVGFVLYFFAAILGLYGLYNFGEKVSLDERGITTQGEVLDLMVIEPYRRAEVKFETNDGQTVYFVDDLYWNQDFNAYQKGQQVEVIYDPADPQSTAVINDFFQRNTAPWWPVIVGAMVFLVGFIMRRVMLGKHERWEKRLREAERS